MASDKKRLRELRAIVEEEGLSVSEIGYTGSSHISLTVCGPRGQRKVTASLSPSCRYANKHFRGDVRRISKEIGRE